MPSINIFDINYSAEYIGEYTESSSFKYLLCQIPFAHVIPLIFPHSFSFIRFTASSDFFISSLLNSSILIGPKTGFQGIGPSFNCWYCLIIAANARSSNILIPFFAYIFVIITSCARDIYVSMSLIVSYFYFITNNWRCFPCT